jgi:hypothetical protein
VLRPGRVVVPVRGEDIMYLLPPRSMRSRCRIAFSRSQESRSGSTNRTRAVPQAFYRAPGSVPLPRSTNYIVKLDICDIRHSHSQRPLGQCASTHNINAANIIKSLVLLGWMLTRRDVCGNELQRLTSQWLKRCVGRHLDSSS